MEFYELIQAVHDLDLARFSERYRFPFLLEDDPQEQRTTRVLEAGDALPDDDGPAARRVFEVRRRDGAEGAVVIGRAPNADLRLDHPTISNRHATLKLVANVWMPTDLHSTNGTRVGDGPAPRGMPTPVPFGSKIRPGLDLSFTFFEPTKIHHVLKRLAPTILGALKTGEAIQSGTFRLVLPRKSGEDAPAVTPPSRGGASSAAEFVVVCDPLPVVSLSRGREVSVGRTAPSDILLPHSSVSRRHATLKREGDVVLVRDLGSSNGTFIGDRRVQKEAFAEPGGPPVVVGPFELKIATPGGDPSEATNFLKADNLHGTLETMPLADMLQAAELNRRTGSIRIEAPDGTNGEIVFSEGAPRRARWGTEVGSSAVLRMLLLGKGRFTYSSKAADGPREIDATFMKLLLEASRVSDEGARRP